MNVLIIRTKNAYGQIKKGLLVLRRGGLEGFSFQRSLVLGASQCPQRFCDVRQRKLLAVAFLPLPLGARLDVASSDVLHQ
jgi:hypothetical protein